ncbi:beta-1,3-galactosyltransferase 1-like [Mercenaria mercenaria]|uniref:beta-1,3-galactosyltransferase 1-like n=1 Tax=Mercenaria mercenaria TaxID=6596 RepID=UPI00234F1377|nr:beta-1,3-galactosyltransferase 1-like [Mercenaria mercenaria]
MKESAKIVKHLKTGIKDLKQSRDLMSETRHVFAENKFSNMKKVNNKTEGERKTGPDDLSLANGHYFPLTVSSNPYNINSKFVCKGVKELSFIVVVHSATTHFMRRSSIRETWANFKLFKRHSMRIVFNLGKPEKDSTQALIEHESAVNKDIVQGNFIDSCRNLTHKGVLGLRWISEFCKQAEIIGKVDDDVFLNVFKLMEELESNFRNKTRQIWCPVRNKGTSQIQRKKGKWKIDENEFKNMTYFPVTYCNGFFTVITRDIIQEMYEAARVTPFFWVDDVYLFGLLPDKIKNVKHAPLMNLNLNEKDIFESKDKKCHLLVANAHSDGIMDKFWFSALQQYKTLAQKYSKDGLFV